MFWREALPPVLIPTSHFGIHRRHSLHGHIIIRCSHRDTITVGVVMVTVTWLVDGGWVEMGWEWPPGHSRTPPTGWGYASGPYCVLVSGIGHVCSHASIGKIGQIRYLNVTWDLVSAGQGPLPPEESMAVTRWARGTLLPLEGEAAVGGNGCSYGDGPSLVPRAILLRIWFINITLRGPYT